MNPYSRRAVVKRASWELSTIIGEAGCLFWETAKAEYQRIMRDRANRR